MVVGRLLSYWEGNSSGAMLNSGKVLDTSIFRGVVFSSFHSLTLMFYLPVGGHIFERFFGEKCLYYRKNHRALLYSGVWLFLAGFWGSPIHQFGDPIILRVGILQLYILYTLDMLIGLHPIIPKTIPTTWDMKKTTAVINYLWPTLFKVEQHYLKILTRPQTPSSTGATFRQ